MARIAKPKRCPFCGSHDSFVERTDLSSWQRVCNDCFAHGPNFCKGDCDEKKAEAAATRRWNLRRRSTASQGEKE